MRRRAVVETHGPVTPAATVRASLLLRATSRHATALLPVGDRSSERFGGRRRSSPPWDQHRRPARTTASIRPLARKLQARDARLWRTAGPEPTPAETLASVWSRYSRRPSPTCPSSFRTGKELVEADAGGRTEDARHRGFGRSRSRDRGRFRVLVVQTSGQRRLLGVATFRGHRVTEALGRIGLELP